MRPVYEIVLPGFYGGTDETDDRVLWVLARSFLQVSKLCPNCRVFRTDWTEEDNCHDFDIALCDELGKE